MSSIVAKMADEMLRDVEHVFIDSLESYKHFYFAKVANLNSKLAEKVKPASLKERLGGHAKPFLDKVHYEKTISALRQQVDHLTTKNEEQRKVNLDMRRSCVKEIQLM